MSDLRTPHLELADRAAETRNRTNGRIPTEVLYEAQRLPEIEVLSELEYKASLATLENVKAVMATAKPGANLVDLYKNEGNSDVRDRVGDDTAR